MRRHCWRLRSLGARDSLACLPPLPTSGPAAAPPAVHEFAFTFFSPMYSDGTTLTAVRFRNDIILYARRLGTVFADALRAAVPFAKFINGRSGRQGSRNNEILPLITVKAKCAQGVYDQLHAAFFNNGGGADASPFVVMEVLIVSPAERNRQFPIGAATVVPGGAEMLAVLGLLYASGARRASFYQGDHRAAHSDLATLDCGDHGFFSLVATKTTPDDLARACAQRATADGKPSPFTAANTQSFAEGWVNSAQIKIPGKSGTIPVTVLSLNEFTAAGGRFYVGGKRNPRAHRLHRRRRRRARLASGTPRLQPLTAHHHQDRLGRVDELLQGRVPCRGVSVLLRLGPPPHHALCRVQRPVFRGRPARVRDARHRHPAGGLAREQPGCVYGQAGPVLPELQGPGAPRRHAGALERQARGA